MKFEAILFDLDNTLAERVSAFKRWANAIYDTERAIQANCTADQFLAMVEDWDRDGYADRLDLFAQVVEHWPDLGWSPEQAVIQYRKAFPTYFEKDTLVTRLLITLRERRFPCGIVTNGDAAHQSAKVRALELDDLVFCVVVSGEVGYSKPEPAIFLEALRQLGNPKVECTLFVGDDIERDVVGARNVDMRTAWLARGRTWPDELPPPDFTLSTISELRGILDAQKEA